MISIIVPIFNKETTIEKCIQSVINQTYTDWELLLIDDGSTDQSAKKILPYLKDTRIHYIYKENGGVSTARNLGIEMAQGEWSIYIDADDYFLTDAFQTLLTTATTHKVDIIAGNFWIEIEGKRRRGCHGKERIVKNNFRAWYFRTCFPRAGVTLYKTTILKQYPFDESLSRFEDAKSLFDIMRLYHIAYTPKCIMVYNMDHLGLSKPAKDTSRDFIFSMDFQKKSMWESLVLANLLNQGLRQYPTKRKILREQYSSYFYLTYIEYILNLILKIYKKIFRVTTFK